MKLFRLFQQYAAEKRPFLRLKNNIYSYGAFLNAVARDQETLRRAGIKGGSTVLLEEEDQTAFILRFVSLLGLQCWAVPLPTNLKERELGEVLSRTDARRAPPVVLSDVMDLVLLSDRPVSLFQDIDETKCGIYHMTSGSTGKPKFCIRTLNALLQEGISYACFLKEDSQDIYLSAAPLYHSFALGAALMACFATGGSIVPIRRFLAGKTALLLKQEPITILVAVPDMIRLMSLANTDPPKPLSLRLTVVGAGPLRDTDRLCFQRLYGSTICGNYGSTKTGGAIAFSGERPTGSLGQPMPGVEIRISDEAGNTVPIGEIGEIRIRSPYMMTAYLDQKAGATFDPEGFYPMGDLVRWDSHGYIYLVGRKKRMLKIGGKTINPQEIENVLLSHPSIMECAVYTEKRRLSGPPILQAAIVCEEPISDTELRSFCLDRLSSYKVPAVIHRVGSLPKNNCGKVLYNRLPPESGDDHTGDVLAQ